MSRSLLARIHVEKSRELFQAPFGRLPPRSHSALPRCAFRFKYNLLSPDSTVIE